MDGAVIVNDFLASSERAVLHDFLEEEIFVSARLRVTTPPIREWDGDSRIGPAISSAPIPDGTGGGAEMIMPTNTPYDFFGRRVREYMIDSMQGSFIGKYGVDWATFRFRAFRYVPNSGLTWHIDGSCRGAFAYYVHEEWRPHWGGQLLVGRGSLPVSENQMQGIYGQMRADACDQGDFISPMPNRLVFIKPGTPHCVTPVTSAAGDRHRLSLGGYINSRTSG